MTAPFGTGAFAGAVDRCKAAAAGPPAARAARPRPAPAPIRPRTSRRLQREGSRSCLMSHLRAHTTRLLTDGNESILTPGLVPDRLVTEASGGPMRIILRLLACSLIALLASRTAAVAQSDFANLVDHVHLAAPDQPKAVEW